MGGVLGGLLGSFPSGPLPAFEQIATTVLSGASASITFAGIPSGYKHLQLRYTLRTTRVASSDEISLRFNDDIASNYAGHRLYGNGSGVAASNVFGDSKTRYTTGAAANNPAGGYGVGVIDILEYSSTAKFKTVRTLNGLQAGETFTSINSALWQNGAAINRIEISSYFGANLTTGSRVSLYGIKG